ncbi:hypothetical protein [Streptomyces sp. NPDC051636]|uniref:hypothetical protein n=1 Tax=Streptomyces sp. NPDC051636 TaxID=3365663 RepID=UPI0037915E8C
MKSLKAAAVVAGSLVIAGAAAPAFAQNATDVTSTSLNSVADTLTKGPVQAGPVQKLDALDTKKKDSVLNTVQGTAKGLTGGKSLLGGLPLHS